MIKHGSRFASALLMQLLQIAFIAAYVTKRMKMPIINGFKNAGRVRAFLGPTHSGY